MSANLKVSGHDVTSHRRDVDPHGRLRDEWVYTITLNLLFFNVLGHAGRDTPSIDSIWRMRGSLSSYSIAFGLGVISVMPLKMAKLLVWIIDFSSKRVQLFVGYLEL